MSTLSGIDFTHGEPGYGSCICCGQQDETRFGVCFDCANTGERKAAHRGVLGHIGHALCRMARGRFDFGTKTDLLWAWERLTWTGDYRPGGCFEADYGIRRSGRPDVTA